MPKGDYMRKYLFIIFFVMTFLTATKVYAAGNISLSASETNVNIGDEFTISMSFSRGTSCFSNCKDYC